MQFKKILLISSLLLSSPLIQADINTGLVAYFPFSGDISDAGANQFSTILFGGGGNLNLVEDRFGNEESAYSFGSGTDFIQTKINGDLFTNAMAYSFWLKTGDTSCHYPYRQGRRDRNFVISNYDPVDGGHFFEFCDAQNFASNNLVSGVPLYDNQWHHVVVNYSDTNIDMYIDDFLVQSFPQSSDFEFKGDQFRFGQLDINGSSGFSGILDDVRIYNRVLTASEVSELYADTSIEPKQMVLDIDGDGVITALGDSVLLIRYQLGFTTGDDLVREVVSENCTRCTDIEIKAYLDKITSLSNIIFSP